MSNFKLSKRSLSRLEGVEDRLVDVIKRAIEVTTVDFMVTEGLRTTERQRELFNAGATKTLMSKHLVGGAVDLAPIVDGKVRWDWPLFFKIAEAVRTAALELRAPIVWGGAWHARICAYDSVEKLQEAYIERRRSQGSKPFLDGCHFELGWGYP